MEQYKLIAFDMDGTLLNSKKEIKQENLKAIDKAFAAGKEVILCTGRCIAELKEYIEQIPRLRYVVGTSGALVYDVKEDNEIYMQAISIEQVHEILEVAKTVDAMPHILTKDSIVSRGDFENMQHFDMKIYIPLFEKVATKVDDIFEYYSEHEMPVAKLNIYHVSPEEREKTKEKLKNMDLVLADAERTSVEISANGTTKGTGLEQLCKYLGITMDEVIAVGDADNDIDVLRKAGLSIAMGNANEKVKSICDVVVSDCDSDGCVEAIEKYLLNESIE